MPKTSTSGNLYRETRVLVLGASGFIGQWVARGLCEKGFLLHLVVRNKEVARGLFAKNMIHGNVIEADLTKGDSIGTLFREIKPSITFNMAGYGVDPSERDETTAYQINAYLVKTTCEAIAKIRDPSWQGRDIVHVGSAMEYGAIGGNLEEKSVCRPTTIYGKSKLAGTRMLEECCKAHEIKGITARLFTVYGAGEHSSRLLPSLINGAHAGKAISLTTGNQKRDFTYVEDVAEGLLRLGVVSAAMPSEIVNLATGKLLSVREFAETAARIMKISHNQLEFGAISTRAEEMEHSAVIIERLRRLIGWAPPTEVTEGIKNTVSFGASCDDKRRIDDGV